MPCKLAILGIWYDGNLSRGDNLGLLTANSLFSGFLTPSFNEEYVVNKSFTPSGIVLSKWLLASFRHAISYVWSKLTLFTTFHKSLV